MSEQSGLVVPTEAEVERRLEACQRELAALKAVKRLSRAVAVADAARQERQGRQTVEAAARAEGTTT